MLMEMYLDPEEAISHAKSGQKLSDAQRAHLIKFLSDEGLSNSEIREALGIEQPYTVSHLKRAGRLSEEELILWHNNPTRITLGHVRAVSGLPERKRSAMLRELIARKIPVHQYEVLARGESVQDDVNIKRYEELLSEQSGYPIAIRYNKRKRMGSITVQYFSLDELDTIASKLGFRGEDL
ncbi:transcriptional regulator [Hydrocarboniclastica marina]|uniref:Transcriptional regulator n=1 Tax=Hydrocarboniclastica marina TaxID=2259620 RepID=A0A4P7XN22_9ALTE|nr:transcriptional regulator [Hydrocarboniclastica marina]QCF28112.1 transcriptional regulator [Hydrocarboniclastica marina]